MANPAIIRYLQENRSKYPIDALKQQLLASGYPANEIDEAIREALAVPFSAGAQPVTPQGPQTRGFFNFRVPKAYTSFGSKAPDFLFGLFGLLISNAILGMVFNILFDMFFGYGRYGYGYYSTRSALWFIPLLFALALLFTDILIAIYFWKRRRWMVWGMIAAVILPIIGAAALILFYVFIFSSEGFY